MSDQGERPFNGSFLNGAGGHSVPTARPNGLLPAPGTNGQSAPESGRVMTAALLLDTLRRWGKIVIPVGVVLAVVAGGLIWWFFEPVYEASAWLKIQDSYLLYPTRGDSRQFVQTQVELIKSPLVVGPAILREDVRSLPDLEEKEDPITWLGKELRVKPVGQSELYQVSFAGLDPQGSATLVNAVIEEYFSLRGTEDAEQNQRVIELLQEELGRQENEAQRLRENVRELSIQSVGLDPFAANAESNVITSVDPLAELDRQITTAQVQGAVLDARIKALEETLSGDQVDVPEVIVDRGIAEHSEVQALKAALSAKEAKLVEYKTGLVDGEEDPLYQDLDREIQSERARLEQVREELRPKIREEMERTVADRRKAELFRMQSDLDGYLLMEQVLKGRYEKQLKDRGEYTGETLNLELLRSDYLRAQEVLEMIASRIMTLRIEQRAPGRVVLMRSAEPSRKPVEVFPYKQIILGTLAGLCLPFGLAVLWERVVRRVGDSSQLQRHSELPVLGEVSRLPVRPALLRGRESRRFGGDLRVFEESVDSLRTCLVLSESLKDMRVFVLTSAANNEGKTTVAVQLAVSCARASGETVLIIDGDMRSPDVHKVLDTLPSPGLSEVLSGDCPVEDAIITDWSKRVHVLPAGKLRTNPHTLVGNGALPSLLDKVRPSYRYVIIDTPPVLAASESLVFAKAADASLICTMRDISRIEQVKLAYERLAGAEGNPIGVVLSGVPRREYSYRYGKYQYDDDNA